MRWVVMESGKKNPLDPAPSERGNVRLVGNEATRGQVVAGQELDLARRAGETLYLSHFATCPWAIGNRKRGGQKATSAPGSPAERPATPPAVHEAQFSLLDGET